MKRILIIILVAMLSWSASGQIITGAGMTTYKVKKEQYAIAKGYRGFAEVGAGMAFEIGTIHGYQFNNYVFVGGG